MNPILLKPASEQSSQVVVLGRSLTVANGRSYLDIRRELLPVVLRAFESLRSRFDVVVCEGAGSLAEPNLRAGDLVNMGLARAVGLPVVVVADVDRGGAFAALFGSLAVLEEEDQALIGGFLLNKFRGDRGILAPALDWLQDRTARPVLGVFPWVRGLWLDAEDSVDLEARREEPLPPLGRDILTVAVVRLPRISNFTDADALAAEPGVVVRFTHSPVEVLKADLAVLPGTKATVEDLTWLRSRGLDEALRAPRTCESSRPSGRITSLPRSDALPRRAPNLCVARGRWEPATCRLPGQASAPVTASEFSREEAWSTR